MNNNQDYVHLVEQARLGSRQSLDNLAQQVRGRLYAYVYRIVLQEDISQDIVQESMLEMFSNLNKLERADRFWPWLRGIAFNKIRHHYTKEKQHKTVSISGADDWLQGSGQTGLTALIGEELKQLVFDVMRQLKPKQRAVLAMRCYEEMHYSQIAQLMGVSELSTRVLFYRAKETLRKRLSHKGFGRGFLLSALALFGKMTAPSEAAVSSMTVTAAATDVGAAAALVGVATSKPTILTLAAAAVLAAGTLLVPLPVDKAIAWTDKTADSLRQKLTEKLQASPVINSYMDEYWYYYPDKSTGPVMIRLMKRQPQTKHSYCQCFENDQANYYFDMLSNTIYINNYRMWRSNLAVAALPTDSSDLTQFLSMVEGQDRCEKTEYVSSEHDGLLVIVDSTESGPRPNIAHHYNVLDEEYFRYNWPTAAKVVDNRDAMHKRGWTYFRINGHIDGQQVSGTGRLPFVYAECNRFYPWLRLNVANRLEIMDGIGGAGVYNIGESRFTTYPSDTFFRGLARPWMGLHTIDTIRRDAAEQRLPFETKYTPGDPKAEVIITHEQNEIIYTIDMKKDLIEKIILLIGKGGDRETTAELEFFYLDDVTLHGEEFVEPKTKGYGIPQQGPGILWLVQLAEGGLN